MNLGTPDPEVERRWAIKKILIDYDLHCRHRQESEGTELAWPTLHDIADRAIDRLDRLYSGEATPMEIMEECEDSEWTPSPPGYEIVEIDIRREGERDEPRLGTCWSCALPLDQPHRFDCVNPVHV